MISMNAINGGAKEINFKTTPPYIDYEELQAVAENEANKAKEAEIEKQKAKLEAQQSEYKHIQKANPRAEPDNGENKEQIREKVEGAFKTYMQKLQYTIQHSLPKLIAEVQELIKLGHTAYEKAEPKFKTMSTYEKAQATTMIAGNSGVLIKIPVALGEILIELEKELQEVTLAIAEATKEKTKVKAYAEVCEKEMIFFPVNCYKRVHGNIKCSRADREEWIEMRTQLAEIKGQTFNPDDY